MQLAYGDGMGNSTVQSEVKAEITETDIIFMKAGGMVHVGFYGGFTVARLLNPIIEMFHVTSGNSLDETNDTPENKETAHTDKDDKQQVTSVYGRGTGDVDVVGKCILFNLAFREIALQEVFFEIAVFLAAQLVYVSHHVEGLGKGLIGRVFCDFFHLFLVFYRNLDRHVLILCCFVVSGPDDIVEICGSSLVGLGIFTVFFQIGTEVGSEINGYVLVLDFFRCKVFKFFIDNKARAYCNNTCTYDEQNDCGHQSLAK